MPGRDALKAKEMKRKGNFYDRIISMQNLQAAAIVARKGKGHQPGVIEFLKNEEGNLLALHHVLQEGNYKTSPYHNFSIFEPKERLISKLPFFPDRIVHHAIMLILEPYIVSWFTADTYSCIKGRGIHAASRAIRRALRDEKGTIYYVKIDIQKFYPSVDHKILKQLLRRKIKDERLLSLMDEIIDNAPGLPIGNLLSQYFANFYLSSMDRFIKEQLKIRNYFRYADDILILGADKPSLHQVRAQIQDYLLTKLRLIIKRNYRVAPVYPQGIDILGYVYFHTHTRLRPTIKVSFCKIIATKPNRASIGSYYGWAKHADCKHLFKTLLSNEKFQRHGDHAFLNKLYRRQNQNGRHFKSRNPGVRLSDRGFDTQSRHEMPLDADRSRWPEACSFLWRKGAPSNDPAG